MDFIWIYLYDSQKRNWWRTLSNPKLQIDKEQSLGAQIADKGHEEFTDPWRWSLMLAWTNKFMHLGTNEDLH